MCPYMFACDYISSLPLGIKILKLVHGLNIRRPLGVTRRVVCVLSLPPPVVLPGESRNPEYASPPLSRKLDSPEETRGA